MEDLLLRENRGSGPKWGGRGAILSLPPPASTPSLTLFSFFLDASFSSLHCSTSLLRPEFLFTLKYLLSAIMLQRLSWALGFSSEWTGQNNPAFVEFTV